MTFSISCPSCGKTFRNIRPELAGKKAKCKCGALVRLQANPQESSGLVVPSPAVSAGESSQQPGVDVPLFDQDFSDLDSILEGVGDVAPLIVNPASQRPAHSAASNRPARPNTARPQVRRPAGHSNQPVLPANQPAAAPEKNVKPRFGAGYFMSGLVGGTIAIWFGLFVVVSKFTLIKQFPFSTLSSQLRNGYNAIFGLIDVPQNIHTTYLFLGWTLFAIGLLLIFVGLAQVLNSFVQVLFQRPLVRWVDGIGAILAFTCVFIFACYVFTHNSFIQSVVEAMPEVEPIIMEDAPEWAKGDFTSEKDEVWASGTRFITSMCIGAGTCLTMFTLSMVRVFKNFTSR